MRRGFPLPEAREALCAEVYPGWYIGRYTQGGIPRVVHRVYIGWWVSLGWYIGRHIGWCIPGVYLGRHTGGVYPRGVPREAYLCAKRAPESPKREETSARRGLPRAQREIKDSYDAQSSLRDQSRDWPYSRFTVGQVLDLSLFPSFSRFTVGLDPGLPPCPPWYICRVYTPGYMPPCHRL